MIRKLTLLSVVCLLLVWLPGTCFAAETTYQITESQQTRLQTIFDQLEINNNLQLQELETLKTELMTDQQKLEGYQKALELSQSQLNIASQDLKKVLLDLKQAQTSLQKANQSFTQYNKEMTAETRKLKLERDISIDINILAAIVLALKH